MDYLDEVRRRQQEALASLLLGGADRKTPQERQERAETRTDLAQSKSAPITARRASEEAQTAQSNESRQSGEDAEFTRTRRADRLWRGDYAYGGEGAEWLVFADGEASDASALSRAFERDARRYDGAFSAD